MNAGKRYYFKMLRSLQKPFGCHRSGGATHNLVMSNAFFATRSSVALWFQRRFSVNSMLYCCAWNQIIKTFMLQTTLYGFRKRLSVTSVKLFTILLKDGYRLSYVAHKYYYRFRFSVYVCVMKAVPYHSLRVQILFWRKHLSVFVLVQLELFLCQIS